MNVMTERKTLIKNLFPDVRRNLRKIRRQGKKQGWGQVNKVKKEYIVKPSRPLYLKDAGETGRSLDYHAEQVAQMTQRYQSGKCLWTGGEPDTEQTDVPLTQLESQLIGMVLNV